MFTSVFLFKTVLVTVVLSINGILSQNICGNTNLTANGNTQFFSSPNYPDPYPNNVDCQWRIASNSSSQRVFLSIVNFNISRHARYDCDLEYVTIYDGDTTSTSSKKLCGLIPSAGFTSTGNVLTVVFHSLRNNTATSIRRFKFEYHLDENHYVCSNFSLTANGTEYYIYPPSNLAGYDNNMNCVWTITASVSTHMIVVTLLNLSMEQNKLCTNDYIIIYDGNSVQSPRMMVTCEESPGSTTLTSTGSSITVVFHSDFGLNFPSFRIKYFSQQKTDECKQVNLWANENAQYITSPSIPNTGLNVTNCQWLITASSPSNAIVLRLLDFHTQNNVTCISNFLTIYDGNTTHFAELKTSCHPDPNTNITTFGNYMVVVFHSNIVNTGIRFLYTTKPMEDNCADISLVAYDSPGIFKSPGFPYKYPRYLDCNWSIKASQPGKIIVLSASEFELAESTGFCYTDYLTFYDITAENIFMSRRACGSAFQKPFTSIDVNVNLRFHSETAENKKGFLISYQTRNNSVLCGNTNLMASDEKKTIDAPGNAAVYAYNIDCVWNIESNVPSRAIALNTYSFALNNTPPCGDYLTIYDGKTTKASKIIQLCGNATNKSPYKSTGSSMTVEFHSDSKGSGPRFNLEYYTWNNAKGAQIACKISIILIAKVWFIYWILLSS